MDVKERVEKALRAAFENAYIRLEDDDGVFGFVVSEQFKGIDALGRQGMIDEAICKADPPLSPEEKRQVLMIAALSPTEFNSVGAKVRVHKVKQMASAVEIMLRGGYSDAQYVRGALNNVKGVKTADPKQIEGIFMSFRATGAKADPLDKKKAIKVLTADPYIEVMPGA